MLTKEQIMQKIEQNREKIKQLGVKKLVLFGSYAQEKAKEASDIDFLVEFAPERGLYDDYIQLSQLLNQILKKEVDLIKPALIRKELKDSILSGIHVEAI